MDLFLVDFGVQCCSVDLSCSGMLCLTWKMLLHAWASLLVQICWKVRLLVTCGCGHNAAEEPREDGNSPIPSCVAQGSWSPRQKLADRELLGGQLLDMPKSTITSTIPRRIGVDAEN